MKLIIDIPEKVYKNIMNDHGVSPYGTVFNSIQNGTVLPDNATNGDVIKTLFKPNWIRRMDDVVREEYEFNGAWWNTPYQKGGEE